MQTHQTVPRVVIVGGGFAGVAAARELRDCQVEVLLIDRRNHHIFQPLLYQVATATLAPADIATPLRQLAERQANLSVMLGEVSAVQRKLRTLNVGRVRALIVGVARRRRVVVDLLEPLDVEPVQALQHRPEVHAPGAADRAGGPEHRQLAHAGGQLLGSRLQQSFVYRIGDQQAWMMRGDGERLRHLAEPAAGDAVHDAGQQIGLLRRDGRDAGFLCHTR